MIRDARHRPSGSDCWLGTGGPNTFPSEVLPLHALVGLHRLPSRTSRARPRRERTLYFSMTLVRPSASKPPGKRRVYSVVRSTPSGRFCLFWVALHDGLGDELRTVAQAVDGVDAHVVKGAAAHVPLAAPVVRRRPALVAPVAGVTAGGGDGAVGFVLRDLNKLLRIRLVHHPVANGEAFTGRLAGIDNLLALCHRHGPSASRTRRACRPARPAPRNLCGWRSA